MTGRSLTRLAGAAVAALVMLIVPGLAASAAASVDIVSLTPSVDGLRAVVEVNDLVAGQEIDLETATMTVDGTPVDSSATLAKDSAVLTQDVLLVLDTSGSMRGDRLVAAKEAALGFVDTVPDNVRIGLIRFASTATVLVEPTTDHDEVTAAVSGLEAKGATVLYDAVVLAAEELAAADVGTAVVLSDGADRTSQATLDEAVAAAEDSGAVFDAVAFAEQEQTESLRQISQASGGTVVSAADGGQLAIAFDEAAQAIASRVIVTGALPEDLTGRSVTVGVSLAAGDETVADTAIIPLAEATAEPAGGTTLTTVPPPNRLTTWAGDALWVALGGIFIALLVLVFYAIASAAGNDTMGSSRLRRSLSVYSMGGRAPAKERETTVLGDTQVARSAVELAGRVVSRRDMESLIGGRLEAAGMPLKAPEWLLIHVGIAIVSGLFFLFVFDMRFLPSVVGLALGLLGPWIYLAVKEGRRTKAFLAALPDTLQLISGSLSAGYSMPQAIDTVVREGQPPMSTEFNRALVEARLGVPLEDALDGVATRMKSQDFSWVVMAIRIQREVGGNLAEVLSTVAATLRERERLRRQVQVLSAEGRLSAWILLALPVVFTIYLVLVRPLYLEPLVTSFAGWVMIGIGVLLLLVGMVWMRRAVQVEV